MKILDKIRAIFRSIFVIMLDALIDFCCGPKSKRLGRRVGYNE
jgi:hypothetical protein